MIDRNNLANFTANVIADLDHFSQIPGIDKSWILVGVNHAAQVRIATLQLPQQLVGASHEIAVALLQLSDALEDAVEQIRQEQEEKEQEEKEQEEKEQEEKEQEEKEQEEKAEQERQAGLKDAIEKAEQGGEKAEREAERKREIRGPHPLNEEAAAALAAEKEKTDPPAYQPETD